jgi:hypothetical protein
MEPKACPFCSSEDQPLKQESGGQLAALVSRASVASATGIDVFVGIRFFHRISSGSPITVGPVHLAPPEQHLVRVLFVEPNGPCASDPAGRASEQHAYKFGPARFQVTCRQSVCSVRTTGVTIRCDSFELGGLA